MVWCTFCTLLTRVYWERASGVDDREEHCPGWLGFFDCSADVLREVEFVRSISTSKYFVEGDHLIFLPYMSICGVFIVDLLENMMPPFFRALTVIFQLLINGVRRIRCFWSRLVEQFFCGARCLYHSVVGKECRLGFWISGHVDTRVSNTYSKHAVRANMHKFLIGNIPL